MKEIKRKPGMPRRAHYLARDHKSGAMLFSNKPMWLSSIQEWVSGNGAREFLWDQVYWPYSYPKEGECVRIVD